MVGGLHHFGCYAGDDLIGFTVGVQSLHGLGDDAGTVGVSVLVGVNGGWLIGQSHVERFILVSTGFTTTGT